MSEEVEAVKRGRGRPRKDSTPQSIQKWEYQLGVVSLIRGADEAYVKAVEAMNEQGLEGWEGFFIATRTNAVTYMMKRPL